MLLVRLAAPEFPDLPSVHDYFLNPQSTDFRGRGQFGTFVFQKRHLEEHRLRPGETLLFSYEATIYYVATAWTGRMDWTGPKCMTYPYCFQVNVATLRRTSFTVQQLETALGVRIAPSHAWPTLPDGLLPEWAVNTLCGGP